MLFSYVSSAILRLGETSSACVAMPVRPVTCNVGWDISACGTPFGFTITNGLWLQFTSCLEWGFICIMGNSRMAAQGLLVFESLSTEFTLYLLLNTTVLGYNVPLCIRLLNKSFPTDWAASPSIHPTGNEFLGHKTLQKYVVNFINCSKTQLQNFICCIHRAFASCETSWIVLFCMFFHNGGNLPDLSQCVETRYAAYSSTCSEETVCHRVGR